MIYHKGNLQPTKAQLAEIRRSADDSFCSSAEPSFMSNFPYVWPGSQRWSFDTDSPVLLKLKNVEPHDDPWAGRHKSNFDFDNPPAGWNESGEPLERLAIFWVLTIANRPRHTSIIHFGCGSDFEKLKAGDFVVFDDRIPHWVMADMLWHGASIQLAPKEFL